MDELLAEFLTECLEGMATLDAELLELERERAPDRIGGIFRIVHTLKGTCGFLGLSRLEKVAHAAEDVLGRLRDGRLEAGDEVVAVVFAAVDRLRLILDGLAATHTEPEGDDSELLGRLRAVLESGSGASPSAGEPPVAAGRRPEPHPSSEPIAASSTLPMAAESRAAAEPDPARTLRVRLDLLEQLMNLVGELVLTRNQLLQATRESDAAEIKAPLQKLNQITCELQEGVMRTRMQPISTAWAKLPRLMRDLSLELGKQIELEMYGGETELDRQILEMIRDPLTHMIRNSADHGLETPDVRRAAGKPATGRVRLGAMHEGGHIIIQIADDGRGLNTDAIRVKALASGLASAQELASLSAEQVQRFIFRPGFSTAAAVSNLSGRGVGLDVVCSNIERIGGTIELVSDYGRGTTFFIKIPLTLAIVSVLIVGAGGQRFGIPQLNIVELVRAGEGADHRIESIDGALILRLRDRLLPLLSLATELGLQAEPPRPGQLAYVVVLRAAGRCIGLLVDRVFDTEEIVIKPLAPVLRSVRRFSGSTILGDGRVIMILDPNVLLAASEVACRDAVAAEDEEALTSEMTSLLVFRAGSATPKAVPLALVTRLEDVAAEAIEHSAGRSVVQYRGQLMPIVDVHGAPVALESGRRPVLFFTDSGRHMGLMVDEIIDITEADVVLELGGDGGSSFGSAIIRGRSTDLLDVAHFVNRIFGGWFIERDKPFATKVSHPEGQRVLLVDDSPFFRNLLKPILECHGYQVTPAGSADQALQLRGRGETFDLIVSDIEMPGMNGFDFAAACRQGGLWQHTPLIALSSHTTPEDLARGRRVGFTNHVGKLDRAALLDALEQGQRVHGEAA
jgi:two-component system chemotaxis sensor kinase CheA